MIKQILVGAGVLVFASAINAEITIKFPSTDAKEYELEYQLISEMVKPRNERRSPIAERITVTNGEAKIKQAETGGAQYYLILNEDDAIPFYTSPTDNINIDILSIYPLEYKITGSDLMDGIEELQPQAEKIQQEYRSVARSENPDRNRLEELSDEYDNLFKDYIKTHPTNPTAVYAMLQLEGEDYISAFESLNPDIRNTTLYPLAINRKKIVEKQIEADKRIEELQSGKVTAPELSLPDLDGNIITLEDYKGKWIILDFWGSWCSWCIKGMPALKEAYSRYSGLLEVIGIDCNESEEAWRKGVEKYGLPWVNVYNSEAGSQRLYEEYGITGFPTKVIVNPEGKIVNITVGEDPEFYNKLESLIGGK